jgi:hypothetical protein
MLAAVGMQSEPAAAAEAIPEFTVAPMLAGGARVTVDGAPFAEYVVDRANKPFLWPIHGPTGKEMTRAYPMRDVAGERRDHPHHRGLTFGHQSIDGSDTWAEDATYREHKEAADRVRTVGRIRHREYRLLAGGTTGVIHAVGDLLDAANRPRLLVDTRLTFSAPGTTRVIDVDSDLVALEEPVHFADMKDAGMFIRVPHSMSVDAKEGGTIVNSDGLRDADAWAKRAPWCDYNGPVDGERLGIAFLSHPASFRHPTPWHVRGYGLFTANPFGPRSLDPAAADGGLTLQPGERVSLRYRVILHRGDEVEGRVADAYEAYAREPRPPL